MLLWRTGARTTKSPPSSSSVSAPWSGTSRIIYDKIGAPAVARGPRHRVGARPRDGLKDTYRPDAIWVPDACAAPRPGGHRDWTKQTGGSKWRCRRRHAARGRVRRPHAGTVNGALLTLGISLGHRTGCMTRSARLGPATSEEIAEHAGLQERYVREWLAGQLTGGIVEHDSTPARGGCRGSTRSRSRAAAGANNLAIPGERTRRTLRRARGRRRSPPFAAGGGVPWSRMERVQEWQSELCQVTSPRSIRCSTRCPGCRSVAGRDRRRRPRRRPRVMRRSHRRRLSGEPRRRHTTCAPSSPPRPGRDRAARHTQRAVRPA